jgi:hypothetical protein
MNIFLYDPIYPFCIQVEARHYMEHSDDGFRLTEAAVTAYVTQIREGLTVIQKKY